MHIMPISPPIMLCWLYAYLVLALRNVGGGNDINHIRFSLRPLKRDHNNNKHSRSMATGMRLGADEHLLYTMEKLV